MSLRDRSILPFNITEREKNHPRKIAGHPRLFRDRLPEIDGKAQGHASAVFRPPLAFAVHVSTCRLLCCQGVSLPGTNSSARLMDCDPTRILTASIFVWLY